MKNIKLILMFYIDGYLIGGCSIKVKDFIEIINFVNKY